MQYLNVPVISTEFQGVCPSMVWFSAWYIWLGISPAMSLHPHSPHCQWLLGWFHILGSRIRIGKIPLPQLPHWHQIGKDIQHQTFPKLSTTSQTSKFLSLFPSTVLKQIQYLNTSTNSPNQLPWHLPRSHWGSCVGFPPWGRQEA